MNRSKNKQNNKIKTYIKCQKKKKSPTAHENSKKRLPVL